MILDSGLLFWATLYIKSSRRPDSKGTTCRKFLTECRLTTSNMTECDSTVDVEDISEERVDDRERKLEARGVKDVRKLLEGDDKEQEEWKNVGNSGVGNSSCINVMR